MSDTLPETGQPIGAKVDATPAQLPGPVTLEGRYGRVERLDKRHTADLWDAVKGHDAIWTYMSAYGPFKDVKEFADWIPSRIALEDPYSYAIVDKSGRAVGIATLMEIRPAMRVIEVGHIVYSPALQKTPLGTEAQYLLARYAIRDARLPPLRVEMPLAQCAVAPRGLALRLHVRRNFARAHDRQRPQPRHRLCSRCSTANGRPAR